MKRFIFCLLLTLCAGLATFAQNSSASGNSTTDASAMLHGTAAISAQLENSLDVRKAKVGDQVILKTKKAIKENGQTVIHKGATLVGRVTEVQERTKGVATSKIGVLFDTLRQNGENLAVSAMVTSITRASVYNSSSDDTFATTSTSSSTRANTQSSSGGLLGGVGSAVGGVVNTTSSTVSDVTRTTGNVLGSTVNTVGSTTGAVTSNIPGLQVSNSTDASASGGSTLSLSGNNLKLEKGTNFNLNVQQSSSVSSSKTKTPGN